jgi:broad specificity phosphatase PhoE
MFTIYNKNKEDYLHLRGGAEIKPENILPVSPVITPETEPKIKPETDPKIKPESKPEIKPDIKPETTSNINVLSVTHNARIRCLLSYIGLMQAELNKINETTTNKKIKEIRIKNCGILKLSILANSDEAEISMFYQGNIEPENRRPGLYFTQTSNGSQNTNDVPMQPYKFKLSQLNIGRQNKNINIYLIRHGEGTHNVKSFFPNMSADTLLTQKGVEQASAAAEYLVNKLVIGKFDPIDFYFCSNLKRSRQTLDILMEYIYRRYTLNIFGNKKESSEPKRKKMIVLPCSHEVSFNENGKCDKEPFFGNILFNRENRMSCDLNSTVPGCKAKDTCCNTDNSQYNVKLDKSPDWSYEIDWTFYKDFFAKTINKEAYGNCENTNMVKLIVLYIDKYSIKK